MEALNKSVSVMAIVALVVTGMLLYAPVAGADRSFGGLGGVLKAAGKAGMLSGRHGSFRMPSGGGGRHGGMGQFPLGAIMQGGGRSHGHGGGSGSGFGGLNGLNGGNWGDVLRHAGISPYGGGGDWQNYLPWDNGYRHEENETAKAIRDVGIANAVVGLVGVLATQGQMVGRTPVPSQAVAAPPAAMAVPPAAGPGPQGYWRREAVVVQPQRYEQYQEWIPELYDSRTGQKIGGGYYETRTRLVPETFQYRDVWVTPTP